MITQDALLSSCILAKISICVLKVHLEKTIAALTMGSVSFSDNEGSLRCLILSTGDSGAPHKLLEIQGPSLFRQA